MSGGYELYFGVCGPPDINLLTLVELDVNCNRSQASLQPTDVTLRATPTVKVRIDRWCLTAQRLGSVLHCHVEGGLEGVAPSGLLIPPYKGNTSVEDRASSPSLYPIPAWDGLFLQFFSSLERFLLSVGYQVSRNQPSTGNSCSKG